MILVLLPGLDGTGRLFRWFIERLPAPVEARVVSYPRDHHLNYGELAGFVRTKLPCDQPHVVLAESFSGPVAAMLGADPVPGLRAVVLVSSFIRRPYGRIGSWLATPTGWLIRHSPTALPIARWFLLRRDSPVEVKRTLGEIIRERNRDVIAARSVAALRSDHAAEWAACRVPTVFLAPHCDRLFRSWSRNAALAVRPSTQLKVLHGPHLLLQHAPDKVVAVLKELGLLD